MKLFPNNDNLPPGCLLADIDPQPASRRRNRNHRYANKRTPYSLKDFLKAHGATFSTDDAGLELAAPQPLQSRAVSPAAEHLPRPLRDLRNN
jgi:hypothetical protein